LRSCPNCSLLFTLRRWSCAASTFSEAPEEGEYVQPKRDQLSKVKYFPISTIFSDFKSRNIHQPPQRLVSSPPAGVKGIKRCGIGTVAHVWIFSITPPEISRCHYILLR
ncbi:unnamed protein product, partial [Scytosiphon promiscuus]